MNQWSLVFVILFGKLVVARVIHKKKYVIWGPLPMFSKERAEISLIDMKFCQAFWSCNCPSFDTSQEFLSRNFSQAQSSPEK